MEFGFCKMKSRIDVGMFSCIVVILAVCTAVAVPVGVVEGVLDCAVRGANLSGTGVLVAEVGACRRMPTRSSSVRLTVSDARARLFPSDFRK